MTSASGIAKQIRYKVESAFGTAPGASGAQLLRRVTSDLSLTKDTYQSAEIRSDYQIADYRHGIRRVTGTINGELSPKTYADFMAAALRRAFAAVTSITAATLTIAASGVFWTVTRSAGSYLTDGMKIGDVVRITAGAFNALNLNKNVQVVTLTATVATVYVLNGTAMFAEGPIASATIAWPGKKTFVPTTGHTDLSFAIEHWFSDIAQSELFLGCKVATMDLALPATGLATIALGFLGKNVQTDVSQYFTSPTALTSTGIVAAVNGVLVAGGTPLGVVTGATMRIDGGYTADPVVGSNSPPTIFPGRVNLTGQLTAYFENATLRDAFYNETAQSLLLAFTTDNTAAADFITFTITRLKFGAATKDDGEKGIIQTLPFQGLLDTTGGAGISTEATTLSIQDSQA